MIDLEQELVDCLQGEIAREFLMTDFGYTEQSLSSMSDIQLQLLCKQKFDEELIAKILSVSLPMPGDPPLNHGAGSN